MRPRVAASRLTYSSCLVYLACLSPALLVAACNGGQAASPAPQDASQPADAAAMVGDAAASGDVAASGDAAGLGDSSTAASFTCDYPDAGASASPIKYVFVVAMENQDRGQVIGNTSSAPYINALAGCFASASAFGDPLPLLIPSEPHYVWMEAGTNAFSDATFSTDDDPSASNSTATTAHLSTQLDAASVSWRSYQQGLDVNGTGACPIYSSGFYAAKHDPYVFFQDVAGNPPANDNTYCVNHHSPLTALAGDLAAGTVAKYNFITPDLCHDMHGASGCTDSNYVHAGDAFLQGTLPALLDFAFANDGIVFLVWDEGSVTLNVPFLALGPGVKRGYVGSVAYTHSSLVATTERIFGAPHLATITASVNDFGDLLLPGALP
jgi:phosphatidylinositol-3-phosphatase